MLLDGSGEACYVLVGLQRHEGLPESGGEPRVNLGRLPRLYGLLDSVGEACIDPVQLLCLVTPLVMPSLTWMDCRASMSRWAGVGLAGGMEHISIVAAVAEAT